MADRDEKDLEKVAQRVEAAHGYLHIDERAAELAKLDEEIAQPGFWDDASHAQSVSKQASVLRDTIAEYDEAAALLDDARAAFDLASEDELFAEEASAALDKLDELLDALEISSWFSERFDGGDAILTVNPGSGGLEAQDWTDMLYRMYVRYAEKKDWKVTVLDVVPGEGIGLDKATIQIEGRNAFGMLKSESGVHRLVRISPTDDKKRRHTTFAGVEVLPVLPDDIEVDLNPADVRVDVYRSSGPGGQCVNTTDSAVRLTHIPTNIVVTCQNEKSQLQNKEAAFRVLKAKLYEREEQKRQEELAELRGKTDSARAEARRAEEKLAAVRREFEDIERQRGEAERTVAQARPSVEALGQKLAALKQELESAAARYEEAQEAVVPLRKEAARLRDALSEAKLKAATLSERQTYTSRVVDARTRDLEAVASSDAEARESLVKKQVAQRRIEPLLALFEELVTSARRWTRDLEEAATAAQDSSTGLHNAVNEARARARAAHDAFDDANARLSAARVDKGRLEVQVDAAVNAIVHDCKVPLDRALETPELEDRGATEDAAFKLRRRIANMGTINPDAAEEYEQLKTRYDYLAAQLSDLDGARRSLAKIVRVIDARMKDDFVRTFDAVNKNFSEIFAVLFPGGSAELTLVDPDDLENTGVEVTAQPRGKRITKMMLMSGGEKSLTALALLFAVYRIRTTPFYILDEVEAALDDSNLRRLTMYLDTLRDTTQLIMITHQRRTMEMADMLFGVSMQADGVTKVVSQKLENALRHAE